MLTFRSMRCLAVVKFATEELTTAKYGCSDEERGAEPHTACYMLFIFPVIGITKTFQ